MRNRNSETDQRPGSQTIEPKTHPEGGGDSVLTKNKVELFALEGKSFDLMTYRGYAKLSDLATISQAHIYDEVNNPGGIQRDLDNSHATSAYRYAAFGEGKLGDHRFWPEIVLNVRDPSVVSLEPINESDGVSLVRLVFDLDKIDKSSLDPKVSRVDGNHRLHLAMGDPKRKFPPVEEITPFSLTIGLDTLAEQAIFKDINDNQKGMNTSHLDHIIFRSTPSMKVMDKQPELWIAERLHEDPESPFLGMVYRGGARTQGTQRFINLRSLKNGVELILSNGKALKTLPGPSTYVVPAQYALIRNYWIAVKKIYSQDWNKDSLLLKGVGYRAMAIVGGYVIDRCLAQGSAESKDMEGLVERTRKTRFDDGRSLDWSKDGPASSYGGMKGVGQLADRLISMMTGIDESTVGSLAKEAGLLESEK